MNIVINNIWTQNDNTKTFQNEEFEQIKKELIERLDAHTEELAKFDAQIITNRNMNLLLKKIKNE